MYHKVLVYSGTKTVHEQVDLRRIKNVIFEIIVILKKVCSHVLCMSPDMARLFQVCLKAPPSASRRQTHIQAAVAVSLSPRLPSLSDDDRSSGVKRGYYDNPIVVQP